MFEMGNNNYHFIWYESFDFSFFFICKYYLTAMLFLTFNNRLNMMQISRKYNSL
uniref:Uncharacterized protein n=1 Tax=viral metagenome TaxID=1070528 RepID=A0A6C0C8L5_9ZZZZ